MRHRTEFRLQAILLLGLLCAAAAAPSGAQEGLVRRAMWGDPAERQTALAELNATPSWTAAQIRAGEAAIRAGRDYAAIELASEEIQVQVEPGRELTLLVQLPRDYDPTRAYPLMLAIGGGPTGSERAARGGAERMARLWSEPAREAGWFVAAVVDTVSISMRRQPQLRYHILRDDHARRIFDALIARYHLDPNRLHSTGVSLGSNYSLAYAEAHPDWLAGVVPVSTEAESRERVLRNLRGVGVYVLEGVNDQNIKAIAAPRKMDEILTNFGYTHVYDEHGDRGHESFAEEYPGVLEWLDARPRDPFPREVVRVAHAGILPPARRFFWIEADTEQAILRARVTGNTISVTAARARRLTFHLSDRLLDLDEPVSIRINGEDVFEDVLHRSLALAVEDALALGDTERFATARVTLDVSRLDRGEAFAAALAPTVEPGPLAFWEQFAMDTLAEERAPFPAELEMAEAPGLAEGLAAARVVDAGEGSALRPGDLILEWNGEPFFAGTDGVAFMRDFILRTGPERIDLRVMRDGEELTVTVTGKGK